MKLALLGPANSIHLQRWAHALVERGHAVTVISQHPVDGASLPSDARCIWLPHRGGSGYFRNVLALRSALADVKPQLLHAHYASGYGSLMALCGFAPALLSVWGSDVYEFPGSGPLQRRLLCFNLRRADALASTSLAMADQVRRLVPDRQHITVTPFGVDIDRFAPAHAGGEPRPLTIGLVKTLAPNYGVDLLLRAFAGLMQDAEVMAQHPHCRLRLVGDGPQRQALQALGAELGMAGRTEFVGSVLHADVPAALQSLDIFAAPSRFESFGVAVIEAGACALPVVVSDAGGLPEVVRHEVTGLVVPREDVAALQAALKRLALDPVLRKRLGEQGRAHVQRHYAWPHCVDLMENCHIRTVEAWARR